MSSPEKQPAGPTGGLDPGESEALPRSLFEKTKAIMLLVEPQSGKITDANPAAVDFYGYSRQALQAMRLDDLNDLPRGISAAERRRASLEESLTLELPQRLASGEVRMVEMRISTIQVADQPLLFSIVQDISERRQAEAGLRLRTAELQAIFNTLPDQFLRLNQEGLILQSYASVSGHSQLLPDEIQGKFIQSVLPQPAGAQVLEVLKAAGRADQMLQVDFALTLNLVEHFYEARLISFLGDQFILVIRDVSEQKQMQLQMLASQKMAGLGTLVAGIAHEINSPLQVITGASQSALDRLEKGTLQPERLRQQLESIHRNGWRVAKIVRSLRTYAHAAPQELEEQDLNEIVRDTLVLIEHQLMSWSNIEVRAELPDGLPLLRCDRTQITQVIINLLNNARDAMPNGGLITLQTGHDLQANQIWLRIADTGTGIPGPILAKIFDPFFTTKPIGDGVGLGLSIVMGIVRAHHADVRVESQPEHGTIFTFTFPLGALESDTGEPGAGQPPSEAGSQGRFS